MSIKISLKNAKLKNVYDKKLGIIFVISEGKLS